MGFFEESTKLTVTVGTMVSSGTVWKVKRRVSVETLWLLPSFTASLITTVYSVSGAHSWLAEAGARVTPVALALGVTFTATCSPAAVSTVILSALRVPLCIFVSKETSTVELVSATFSPSSQGSDNV